MNPESGLKDLKEENPGLYEQLSEFDIEKEETPEEQHKDIQEKLDEAQPYIDLEQSVPAELQKNPEPENYTEEKFIAAEERRRYDTRAEREKLVKERSRYLAGRIQDFFNANKQTDPAAFQKTAGQIIQDWQQEVYREAHLHLDRADALRKDRKTADGSDFETAAATQELQASIIYDAADEVAALTKEKVASGEITLPKTIAGPAKKPSLMKRMFGGLFKKG